MKTELSWTSSQNSVHKQTHRLSTCDLRAPPSTPGSLLWDLPKVGSEKVIETGGSEPLSIHSPPHRLPQPGEEQCRHLCQSDGENFLVSRGAQFVDGTRCEWASPPPFGSTAACLRGTCQVESNHERQVTDFMSRLLIAAARPSSAVWL